jgi:lipopolysaccharide/colanic/teichoic acid biosynthesis glycosyltransferase
MYYVNPTKSTIFNLYYGLWTLLINILFISIFLPFFLVISPIIWVLNFYYNPGPLLFFQTREGRNQKPFKMVKYRSMVTTAESNGPQWAKQNDERITRLGKLLRATRLDEIPQVLNVLFFQINVIGPRAERPELSKEIIKSIPNFHDRLTIKPGITGLAQIRSGYTNDLDGAQTKLIQDLFYIKNQSVLTDIRILIGTVGTVLKKLGY